MFNSSMISGGGMRFSEGMSPSKIDCGMSNALRPPWRATLFLFSWSVFSSSSDGFMRTSSTASVAYGL